jgi:hypothetical protein
MLLDGCGIVCVIVQAVSHWRPTTETVGVQSQVRSCVTVRSEWFSQTTTIYPANSHSTNSSIFINHIII